MHYLLIFFLLFSFTYANNIRHHYARHILNKESIQDHLRILKPSNQTANAKKIKIGIIGAGITGLYAALLLKDLGIDFQLLEANKEYIGGRLFTYHFNHDLKKAKTCDVFYDYSELGAMRIPSLHNRVVGNEKWSLDKYLRNHPNVKNKPKTIKLYLNNENTLYYYNGKKIYRSNNQKNDPLFFGKSKNNGKGIPDAYASRPYSDWLDIIFNPLIATMQSNATKAFEFLEKYDYHSVRSFMASFDAQELNRELEFNSSDSSPIDEKTGIRLDRRYPHLVIDWLESLDTGTGEYDRSLTEIVLDAFNFLSNDWKTIDGGVKRLTDAILEVLLLNSKSKRLQLNTIVNKISKVNHSNQLKVNTKNGKEYKYDHVISTVPLGILQNIDTSELNFDVEKRMAVRILAYDSAIKIALKFKSRWWQDPKKMKNKPIIGGQTLTDLPIRKIVYPSFGVECKNATGTLLVSYAWSQDALRLGSKMSPKIPAQKVYPNNIEEQDLVKEALDQLALIHGDFVKKEYTNKYIMINWSQNPLSMGPFAYFGPGQFKNNYQSMIKPAADGYLHFAGDTLSISHGWIQGSLDSAYRAVLEVLMKENMQDKIMKLKQNWGEVEELNYFQ